MSDAPLDEEVQAPKPQQDGSWENLDLAATPRITSDPGGVDPPAPPKGLSLGLLATVHKAAQAPQQELPGDLVGGRYEIVMRLGEGGMGTVYRARDRQLPREVAIKRLRPRERASERGLARFLQEARAIAGLNQRHIVAIYDLGEDPKGPYIVMELLPGGDLQQKLDKHGRFGLDQALGLVKAIGQALGYAHKRRVIHRDVKPSNILFGEDATPKLVDFGLAQALGSSDISVTGQGIGTLAYMSPEQQVNAKRADHRSDIYALAKTLYHLVTGEVPLAVDLEQVPATIRGALRHGLKGKPEDRPFSVEDFLEELSKPGEGATRPSAAGGVEGQCPGCGTPNLGDARFCARCGAGLFEPCPKCQKENRTGIRHCTSCGVNVTAFKTAKEALAQAQDQLKQRRYGRAVKEAERGLETQCLRNDLEKVLTEAQARGERFQLIRGQLPRLLDQEAFEEAEVLLTEGALLDPSPEEFQAILAELPGKMQVRNARRLLAQAVEATGQRDLEKAIDFAAQAHKFDDQNTQATELLAELTRKRDRFETTLAAARRHQRNKQPSKGLELANSVLGEWPYPAARQVQAECSEVVEKVARMRAAAMQLVDQENYEQVAKLLEEAVALDSQEDLKSLLASLPARIARRSALRRLARARLAVEQRDLVGATCLVEEAVRRDGSCAEAAQMLGELSRKRVMLEDQLGGATAALKSLDFEEAVSLATGVLRGWEYPVARKVLDRAQGLRRQWLSHAERADLLLERHRYGPALVALQQARRVRPTPELETKINQARTKRRAKRTRIALVMALSMAVVLTAWAYADHRKLNEAEVLLEQGRLEQTLRLLNGPRPVLFEWSRRAHVRENVESKLAEIVESDRLQHEAQDAQHLAIEAAKVASENKAEELVAELWQSARHLDESAQAEFNHKRFEDAASDWQKAQAAYDNAGKLARKPKDIRLAIALREQRAQADRAKHEAATAKGAAVFARKQAAQAADVAVKAGAESDATELWQRAKKSDDEAQTEFAKDRYKEATSGWQSATSAYEGAGASAKTTHEEREAQRAQTEYEEADKQLLEPYDNVLGEWKTYYTWRDISAAVAHAKNAGAEKNWPEAAKAYREATEMLPEAVKDAKANYCLSLSGKAEAAFYSVKEDPINQVKRRCKTEALKDVDEWLRIEPNNQAASTLRTQVQTVFVMRDTKTNSIGITLTFIPPCPAGFDMGSPPNEKDRSENETQHHLIFARGFFMGTTPVTQAQWQRVMNGKNPSHFLGNDRPVENVSWRDAQEFCQALSRMPEEKGRHYRLPKEAEWEYACRAGTTTAYYTGDREDQLDAAGWYVKNSNFRTHPVGQKAPNDWGLYDMHGNVSQWCDDNPGATDLTSRVLRGGSWISSSRECRAAYRSLSEFIGYGSNTTGFRVVMDPPE